MIFSISKPSWSEPCPPESGQMLSHYRLVEKIGEGGMGMVWRAEDTVLSRTVAIKVLPADKNRDDKRRQMFLDEAKAASSISDARIVQVYEFGHEGDLDFIVMEYVEGKPLRMATVFPGSPWRGFPSDPHRRRHLSCATVGPTARSSRPQWDDRDRD